MTTMNEIIEKLNCGHLSNAMVLLLSCYVCAVHSERRSLYIREKQQQFNECSYQYRFPSCQLSVSLKIKSIYDNDKQSTNQFYTEKLGEILTKIKTQIFMLPEHR